ncbi:MAG: addiction module protein [Xanthomonadales bacterium]|nr:addiction module protein [Xanthomonadales bacterium]
MNAINIDSVLELPVAERIKLVEAIWDSVAKDTAGVDLPAWQADELDRRMAYFERNPTEGAPWAEVKRHVSREE